MAGAVLEAPEGVLLVCNRRRDGSLDWSPPGGVIDAGEDVLTGLAREVQEETGFVVTAWEGSPLYQVEIDAPDLDWHLVASVHRAASYHGELVVEDPDGIVVEAAFVDPATCAHRLAGCARWVREPLAEWLAERWGPDAARGYAYDVRGTRREELAVERTSVASG